MNDLFAVPLISKNGVRGSVLTTSKLLDESPEKTVIFESGRQVSIPSKHLHLQTDGAYFLDLTVDPRRPDEQAAKTQPNPVSPDSEDSNTASLVIPVIEEQATVTRKRRETGRIRVHKSTSETPVTVDEPTVYEEYTIERVPFNRVVAEAAGSRVEGDTTIIPVYEEETVTTKRLVLREEIHLIKTQREKHTPQTVLLRKQKVEIERL